jgi:hypothetical protein
MSLCEFGCGNLATHTQKNGKRICGSTASKCPVLKKKNGNGNKGRNCTWSDKLSASNKKTKATQTIMAWNKGITKDQHPGMMAVSIAQKKLAEEQIQKIIPTDDPIYNNIRKYRSRIVSRSNYTYKKNKEILNPNNYTVGKYGENVYHLDHIYPVAEAFKYNIPIELMSSIENLQMLLYNANIKKSNSVYEIPESIKNYLKENKCVTSY